MLVLSGEALGVNDAKYVVGVYTQSSLARPFLWSVNFKVTDKAGASGSASKNVKVSR